MISRIAAVFVISLFLVGAVSMGCTSWGEPDAIEKTIAEDGADTRQDLDRHLGAVDEEERADVAPMLVDAYLDDETLRDDIMVHLVDWHIEEVQPACIEEIVENHTGHVTACAKLLHTTDAQYEILRLIDAYENIDDEEHRENVGAALAAVYLEFDDLRPQIMRTLLDTPTASAADAYVEEAASNHTGESRGAAETLGDLEARSAIPGLINAFRETDDDELHLLIANSLTRMPDLESLELASDLLIIDVDERPIELARTGCKLVGELATQNPAAIDDDIRRDLIYARFLVDEYGRVAETDCDPAIQKIGPSMVPVLIDLFDGNNEDVASLLRYYHNPDDDEFFPPITAQISAVELLSAMRAPEAVERFSQALSTDVVLPDLEAYELTFWRSKKSEMLNEMIHGLGDIGDSQARGVLESVLDRSLFDDEWRTIADPVIRFQMLQDAPRALARLGDRNARPALVSAATADITPGMVRLFEAMPERLRPLDEQYRPQWIAAKSFTYLAEADDRPRYEELVQQFPDDEQLRDKLRSFEAAFDVMDQCESIESSAERARCFSTFFDDDRQHAAHKAVFELSRLPADAASPIVAEALDTTDLELRKLLIFAGYRVPSVELLEAVERVLDAEFGRSRADYRASHFRLRLLRGWLVSHGHTAAH